MTSKEWNKVNPEKRKAFNQRYREMNPDKFKMYSRKANFKRLYGITLEDYDKIVVRQGRRCSVCGKEKKLVVDHNHKTGKVRGLLCKDCNFALGWIHDDVRIAENIILYLKREDSNG